MKVGGSHPRALQQGVLLPEKPASLSAGSDVPSALQLSGV